MLFPVPYSKPLLFIYFIYSRVYLLSPYSYFIPSLPSLLVTIGLFFYVCESVSIL